MIRTMAYFGMLSLLLIGTTGLHGADADRRSLTYHKEGPNRIVTQAVIAPGDREGHQLVQSVEVHPTLYSDPDFGTADSWVYMQKDETLGSGTHRGTFVDLFEDGARIFGTFEGTHEMLVKEDGMPIVNWQGTMTYAGGTGRFNHIKGQGSYRGSATPEQPFYETGGLDVVF